MDQVRTSHPLQRAGISQSNRRLAALSPAYAPLDEHTEQDVLAYMWELAKTVVYHEVKDDKLWKSDWLDFLRVSLPIQLALIANFDIQALRSEFDSSIENFKLGLDRDDFEPLFRKVGDIAVLLNRWHMNLPENTPLKTDLESLIEKDVRFVAVRFARLANQVQGPVVNDVAQWSLGLRALVENPVWQISISDLMLSGVSESGLAVKGTLRDRHSYFLDQLVEVFQVLIDGLRRIIDLARTPEYQQRSLAGIKNHPAHIGLLIAFNRMFDRLREEINGVPARQLDFYFKEVLGLTEADAIPDKAHIVFELDKTIQAHKVEDDVEFKAAGKDNNNAEIIFKKTGGETVLNRARVDSLRTIFRERKSDKTTGEVFDQTKSLRSAIGANFWDGIEEPFPEPGEAQWETLGGIAYPNGGEQDYARIGMFVASPALLLSEGGARVIITFTCKTPFQWSLELGSLFKVYYSSEEGWVDATDFIHGASALSVKTTKDKHYIKVFFYVKPGVPLTPADPKVLEVDYGTVFPMVKLEMKKPSGMFDWQIYDLFSGVEITGINIKLDWCLA